MEQGCWLLPHFIHHRQNCFMHQLWIICVSFSKCVLHPRPCLFTWRSFLQKKCLNYYSIWDYKYQRYYLLSYLCMPLILRLSSAISWICMPLFFWCNWALIPVAPKPQRCKSVKYGNFMTGRSFMTMVYGVMWSDLVMKQTWDIQQ